MHPTLERILVRIADAFFDRWPQPEPCRTRLRDCKLIAHRGEHDNRQVLENSLAAFERAEAAGVWGLELDVRWSADANPVVVHDPDLRRLHGARRPVQSLTHSELRDGFAAIPDLDTVVHRFGGRMHLMIELKPQSAPSLKRRYHHLRQALAPLAPVRDYHLMSLQPRLLEPVDWVPREALIAIAASWPQAYSRWVLERGWGGLCGHYLLMTGDLLERHKRRNQIVGTGYAASRNALFRELNRGVDWIFSNCAGRMQGLVRDARLGRPRRRI